MEENMSRKSKIALFSFYIITICTIFAALT